MDPSTLRGCITACVALLAPALAPAQQVWNVSTQPQLLAAIAAAAPGDVIQLAATGTFDVFTLDKGVTLRGPATIVFQTSFTPILVNVPSGEIAQLVDLTFQDYVISMFTVYWSTLEIHGSARLDGCHGSYVRLVNANAVIERCVLGSRAPGVSAIYAQDSILGVHGSSLFGSSASFYNHLRGGPGITASGSGSLHLSSSSVQGGYGADDGHNPPAVPAPGISTSVPTWLSDATVIGGDSNTFRASGAPGLVVNAAKTFHARCTITGGVDARGVSAPAINGHAIVDPTLLGVRMTLLQRGQPASIDVIADQPGVPLAIFAQVGLNDPQIVPYVTQPLWLGSAAVLVAAGVSGSNSALSLAWQTLPDPTFENVSVSFVGVGLGGAGVQITPTAGGLIR